MKILIASDIFGRTPELEELSAQISSKTVDTIIADPYRGRNMKFEDEKSAYDYFQKNTGLEQYKKDIDAVINSIFKKKCSTLLLIGFSVGASCIWNLSEKISRPDKTEALCFYGSQIRFSLKIDPIIKTTLILPKSEPHFNINNMEKELLNKKNVNCEKTPFLHGFMNKKSVNFDTNGYEKYLKFLNNQSV